MYICIKCGGNVFERIYDITYSRMILKVTQTAILYGTTNIIETSTKEFRCTNCLLNIKRSDKMTSITDDEELLRVLNNSRDEL